MRSIFSNQRKPLPRKGVGKEMKLFNYFVTFTILGWVVPTILFFIDAYYLGIKKGEPVWESQIKTREVKITNPHHMIVLVACIIVLIIKL